MTSDDDIWDQPAALVRVHDEQDGVELPPLEGERPPPRPVRDVLADYLAAGPSERERFTLILENGQAFAADDITDLLKRADSPFR